MQKSKSFCLFIPLLFPILIISCSKHTHYDGATFREYENFDSQGLTVIITPDAQNIDIEYNFDSSLVKEFEVLFRHNINEHLSPFLAKYSTLDHVSWGAIKPRQSLATWEFEIQELKLHFNLPTDNSKIEFKDHDADIVLILGKIEINYLTYVSKGHMPNARDYYHSSTSNYYFDISYLYWDNQKGQVISFGNRLFHISRDIQAAITSTESNWKKIVSKLAIKLLYATPFQGEWETGSLLYYKNL